MYGLEKAKKIKDVVNNSDKPVLVKDTVDYIDGYEELKYYYSNEDIKNKHIDLMKQDKYCKYMDDNSRNDILYMDSIYDIKVLVGFFHKELKPFLKE